MAEFTILYENHANPDNSSIEPGWGLSFFIQFNNHTVLFDTGWNGDILLRNAKKMGKDLSTVNYTIISHPHWDHMGGIPQVISVLKDAVVFLPEGFSQNQMKEIKRLNPNLEVNVNNKRPIYPISTNLALTSTVLGEMNIKEHALIIKQNDGTGILVVGCLHPGLEQFVEDAKEFAPISAIVGGLHGFKDIGFLEDNRITYCAIGHCTKHMDEFRKSRDLILREIFVGDTFMI